MPRVKFVGCHVSI